jgi:peptide/nickel transport system permease protein
MSAYILRRVLGGLLQLFVLLVVVFVLVRATGDPTDLMLPAWASRDEQARLREALGLDRPLPVQFGRFVANAAQGDFGNSLRGRRPVADMISSRFVNSAKLAGFALVLAVVVAIPLGVLSAVHRGSPLDSAVQGLAILGLAMPSFLIGILLVLVFSLHWQLLPTGGMGGVDHYVLPGIALASFVAAGLMRLTRSSTLEVLDRQFITFVRVKGVKERVIVWKHALRNALIPVVTYAGMQFGFLIGGSVVIESVFAWPGMGRMTYEAVLYRDFPVIQATVLAVGAVIIAVNLLIDLVYLRLDPRIRYS